MNKRSADLGLLLQRLKIAQNPSARTQKTHHISNIYTPKKNLVRKRNTNYIKKKKRAHGKKEDTHDGWINDDRNVL